MLFIFVLLIFQSIIECLHHTAIITLPRYIVMNHSLPMIYLHSELLKHNIVS